MLGLDSGLNTFDDCHTRAMMLIAPKNVYILYLGHAEFHFPSTYSGTAYHAAYYLINFF